MPVYNEAGSIADILDLVRAALPGRSKEIVIVDNGSTDGTRDWLTRHFTPISDSATSAPPGSAFGPDCTVRVIFHASNKGKGGALQTAMRAATGAVIVIQDADLEYDPSDWTDMYDLIAIGNVADVVYGSRFYGKPHRSLYFHHYIANRTISLLFNALFNQTLTDVEVCYKMFTREVLQSLNITSNDFGVEVQISAQIALAQKWRIYEMGIRYYGRTYSEGKKINWKDGVKALWYLIRFRINPGNCPPIADSPLAPTAPPTRRTVSPAGIAALALVLYVAALFPQLSHHNFDFSALIIGGREFVDNTRTPTPILVNAHFGYDGQFYYRLALDPLTIKQDAYGVHIDHVPWRAQRILYPVITHFVSLGRAAWVPLALLLVNLAGLATIGVFASRLANRLDLGWTFVAAIMLWPGLIITLGRDTTEIVASAFLLAAIDSYFAGRHWLFALCGAATVLTRETSLAFLFGVFAFEFFRAMRRNEAVTNALLCGLAMVPYLLWRVALMFLSSQSILEAQRSNVDRPFFGYIKAFHAVHLSAPNASFVIAGLVFLLTCLALVLTSIIETPRRNAIMVGWLFLAAPMLCLAAGGPLVEPIAYFRAFTECFIIGALILAQSPLWRPIAILPCISVLWYGAWSAVMATNW